MQTPSTTTTGGAATGRPSFRAPFRVLCVCEGNICRSPVAEVLLRDALGPAVTVSSAGTRAVVGAPVAPQMEDLLRARGVDADGFHARQLTAAHLREADLVLTMTARQRSAVVSLVPAVVRRTFTLRELARLLDGVGPADLDEGPSDSAGGAGEGSTAGPEALLVERLHRALPVAAARRGFRPDPREDDISDPYGRDDRAFRRAFDAIATAVDAVADVVRPQ